MIEKIIDECLRLYPCELDLRYNEPMSHHTTFKVGGPAGFFLRPKGDHFCQFAAALLERAHAENVRVFILGGGANIVVSDDGIRGIVLDTGGYKGLSCEPANGRFVFKSGTPIDEAAETAAAAGFSGLEFFAGMPGTAGGAVWMNARCYDHEIAGVLAWTEIIDEYQKLKRINTDPAQFGYKTSPFQKTNCLIISAAFNLQPGNINDIKNKMNMYRKDRKEKGHYLFPCAGSAFKNNRSFEKPTGIIIDELGLRGFKIGGAQIAPFHGNIVINTGTATASDIRALMDEVAAKVKAATGFVLEPEILFV